MYRIFALLLALLLTGVSLSSAVVAASVGRLRFELAADPQPGQVRLTLGDERRDGSLSNNSVALADLLGLDRAALAGDRQQPIRFALIREAGRVDCAGNGSRGQAAGACRFSADPRFADLLASRGIARPDERQAFALALVGAGRALVDALAAARYAAPSLDDLTALAALDVTPAYIAELSAQRIRPARIDDLIAFKAVGVTPAYVEALRRAGYSELPTDTLIEFRALDVSPAYLSSLKSVGYDGLTASEVVQLKALGITADYIARFQRAGFARLPVDKLIESKAVGVEPEEVRALQGEPFRISADELVRLNMLGLLP